MLIDNSIYVKPLIDNIGFIRVKPRIGTPFATAHLAGKHIDGAIQFDVNRFSFSRWVSDAYLRNTELRKVKICL